MTATAPDGVVALRAIGPLLIELPFPVPAGLRVWAASIWPDPATQPGWGRQLWSYDHDRRGWIIPNNRTHGAVIELGAATHARRRQPARTQVGWYSVALAHDHQWLVCTTPFTNPAAAHHHATQLTDHHRQAAIERYAGSRPEAGS